MTMASYQRCWRREPTFVKIPNACCSVFILYSACCSLLEEIAGGLLQSRTCQRFGRSVSGSYSDDVASPWLFPDCLQFADFSNRYGTRFCPGVRLKKAGIGTAFVTGIARTSEREIGER